MGFTWRSNVADGNNIYTEDLNELQAIKREIEEVRKNESESKKGNKSK